jgi:hypothetical protein
VTQVAAHILKRVHLIIAGAAAGNERIAQGAITIRNFSEYGRFLGSNFVAQIVGHALHPRPIILEALTGLTARGAG